MKVKLTPVARRLRRRSTDAERKLWSVLRDRQLAGFKFKRQVPRGSYVVDFLCTEAGLAVEVDGGQHDGLQSDQRRTIALQQDGLRVLRFWNHDVLSNLEGVAVTIERALKSAPSPRPSPQGGEGAPAHAKK